MRAVLLVLFSVLAVGCDEAPTEPPTVVVIPPPTSSTTTTTAAPSPPPPPTPPTTTTVEPTTCVPPGANDSRVTARPPGTCLAATAATSPCVADYSVSVTEAIDRILWSLPGADASEVQVATGSALYRAPGTYAWTNKICTSTATDDPTDSCCRLANGVVAFTEP